MVLLFVQCYTEVMSLHIFQSAFTVITVTNLMLLLGSSEGMLMQCPVDLI